MTSLVPKFSRTFAAATRAAAAVALLSVGLSAAQAEGQVLPREVPKGTKLVVGDQNERLQTLIIASGEQAKLAADVTYANFIGGPAILEAFRAGALDLATVGSTPPIQAQAAGEEIPIVAAQRTSEPDYKLAVRPGLKINTLEELRGKKIAYAEGTGRQPFVLNALKQAGLIPKDVTLIRLRASDFPDAVRSGQVDVASLNEPHFSRYLTTFEGASAVPDAQHDRLPRNIQYLYASAAALKDPAKTAAIRDFVIHWIAANRWSEKDQAGWIDAYFVKKQNLKPADGKAITDAEGITSFPLLKDLIAEQQVRIDLIHEAGDIPKRLDAKAEFDLRFDEVLANAPTN